MAHSGRSRLNEQSHHLCVSGSLRLKQHQMVRLLVEAGSDLNGHSRSGSCDNVEAAGCCLSAARPSTAQAMVALEEALYWNSRQLIDLLLRRGASIHNCVSPRPWVHGSHRSFFNNDAL